jgi:hypothetical protein
METIGNQIAREMERRGEGISEAFEAKGSRGEVGPEFEREWDSSQFRVSAVCLQCKTRALYV